MVWSVGYGKRSIKPGQRSLRHLSSPAGVAVAGTDFVLIPVNVQRRMAEAVIVAAAIPQPVDYAPKRQRLKRLRGPAII